MHLACRPTEAPSGPVHPDDRAVEHGGEGCSRQVRRQYGNGDHPPQQPALADVDAHDLAIGHLVLSANLERPALVQVAAMPASSPPKGVGSPFAPDLLARWPRDSTAVVFLVTVAQRSGTRLWSGRWLLPCASINSLKGKCAFDLNRLAADLQHGVGEEIDRA